MELVKFESPALTKLDRKTFIKQRIEHLSQELDDLEAELLSFDSAGMTLIELVTKIELGKIESAIEFFVDLPGFNEAALTIFQEALDNNEHIYVVGDREVIAVQSVETKHIMYLPADMSITLA